METESEFGKGLTYCLGLFLAHAERDHCSSCAAKKKELNINRGDWWFHAASDHLYELEIPETLPAPLQDRLKRFRDEMLDKGHGAGLIEQHSEESINEAIHEAKALLMEIDKAWGVPTTEANWK